MNIDWKNRYEVAIRAAQQAGQLALSYFDQGLAVEWKPDNSPVTRADREAERQLRTTLLEKFPQDGFLGEESGEHQGTSGFRWIIDPIDGTRSFVQGTSGFRWIIDPIDGTRSFVRNIPVWATLVGLEYKDEQIAGVAVLPALGQTFRALRGDGAYRDDRPIHVSTITDLSESMIFYSSLSWFVKAGKQEEFLNLITRSQRQRGFGDFYGFVLVAQGRFLWLRAGRSRLRRIDDRTRRAFLGCGRS